MLGVAQVPAAAGSPADVELSVRVLTVFGRDHRQITQRIGAGATISDVVGHLHGLLKSGLCLVSVARKNQRRPVNAMSAGTGQRRLTETKSDRPASRLESPADVASLERVKRAQDPSLR